MTIVVDAGLGVHQAAKRRTQLDELDVVNATIGAGASVLSAVQYSPGYLHFFGVFDATTPAVTTIEIRVQPFFELNPLAVDEEFVVATIAAPASGAPRRYSFAWGAGRGLLTSPNGATYIFSTQWRLRIANTGANVANVVSVLGVECV